MIKFIKIFFLIILFLLISLSLLIYKYDFVFHNNKYQISWENMNLQGIECINNEIILTSSGAEIFKLKGDTLIKLGEFIRYDEEFYNNKHILAHTNSIVLFDNRNIFVLGNLSSSSPVLAKINYDNFLKKKTLVNVDILEMYFKNDFDSLHIEKFPFLSKDYLLIGGRKNGKNLIQLYDVNTKKAKCNYYVDDNIQNIFWDYERNTLNLSQNVIGYYGGKLENFVLLQNDSYTDCPQFEIQTKKIIVTLKELQGYTICNMSKYYLYTSKNNKSYIYSNNLI